ncbi:hypothetical protein JW906_08030 [bacterium]|nr:hypothetical protein [bacterium]
MRVYFDTNGDRVASPAARMWFYQMRDYLFESGMDADLNRLGDRPYDIAVIHWARPEAIRRVLEHSPNAHIGVLNPGYLGFPTKWIPWSERKRTATLLRQVVNNVDFFIITGFMWGELLLPFNRRVYQTIDYDDPEGKPIKQHTRSNGLTVGYHGNPIHFGQAFFPHGANALKRLAGEFDLTLKVITSKAESQPRIGNIRTEYVEFNLANFADEIMTFDIGICPIFSKMEQMADPLVFIRNPNRVHTLLFYGIPSVTSPVPQTCHDLKNEVTTLFAVSEEGWYNALKRLITQPELRNRLGSAGRKMVEENFSTSLAVERFITMLNEEIGRPLVPKEGFHSRSLRKNGHGLNVSRILAKD